PTRAKFQYTSNTALPCPHPSSEHPPTNFFYCYAPLPDLHSFPTRRSSDLGRRAGPGGRRAPPGRPGRRGRLPGAGDTAAGSRPRSEEHTSELQSREKLVCRLLLGKKNRDRELHLYD